MTTTQTKNYKQYMGFFALLLAFAASLIFSYYVNRDGTETMHRDHTQMMDSLCVQNKLINSFREENIKLHNTLQRLVQERRGLEELQKQVENQYHNLYEKIDATADVDQPVLTDSLLAKHRRTKLQRNK